MRGKRFWGIGMVLVGISCALAFVAVRLGPVAAGYKAKTLCSGVFLSGRSVAAVLTSELEVDDQPILWLVSSDIDRSSQVASARFLGVIERRAVFRPGLGCTLAIDKRIAELRREVPPLIPRRQASLQGIDRAWPEGEAVMLPERIPGIDLGRLDAAIDRAFVEPDLAKPRRTRAVVVVLDGRIIAERYAPGIKPDTPLIGWSMTKSAMNALAGILVAEGRLALHHPVPLPQWSAPDDPRRHITLDHLLRMTPGLEWDEDYRNPFSDVITLSWGVSDAAAFAAQRPLVAEPGTVWNYSSGTSTILARVIRAALDNDAVAYLSFPRRALFDPLGMRTATIEPDAVGTFGGASFMYASARDWARFGLLYLNDGRWHGERILPQGWVDYSTRFTPQSEKHDYAAHFWREVPEPYYAPQGERPQLPSDAYHAAGHWGQFVSVLPSRRLVVIRLGLAMQPWSWDQERFLLGILDAVGSPQALSGG